MSELRALLRLFGPAIGLIASWVLFAALAGGNFTSWSNQQLMLQQTAVVGTAAVGATLIIVAGGIDLSVGSTIALGTMVTAFLLDSNWPPSAAALGGVATGLLVGATIGTLVVGHLARIAAIVAGIALGAWIGRGVNVPLGIGAGVAVAVVGAKVGSRLLGRVPLSPFIITLGLWGALRGLAKGLGDNKPIYPPKLGWIPDLMNVAHDGIGAVLPPSVWILLGLALLAGAALRYTRFGRHIFAIGSNEETARLCGIRIERTKLLVYTLGVGCAGIASLLQLSYLSMGDATTAGGYELRVIAAVVIGGASLSGGVGSIGGTLIGALIMTVVDNGCTKLGLDNWVQEVVTGAIIVAAVALDRLRTRAAD